MVLVAPYSLNGLIRIQDMTYLDIVNNILKRLRERTVSTVNESSYSSLIAVLVNDAKESVENAWNRS